ncbi:FmdB family zinc ribbon protein [Desulfonema magnum]|uniref:Zinc ribbon domain-containing protein n=1 Tax=Desulfonema magnum TaxID=45655 RepID=A0A975BZ33_9BACT|nr:FmdB family zinc ribbon protein [Desulfonema magnum]QTA93549.1 Zinc ribbon domain-containing protein [Desulfonema magnum]
MPLFDYLCLDCGGSSEILITGSADQPKCNACGSHNLKKLLSAHASMSGPVKNRMPGPGDTGCCGSAPGHANCAGPGSCCGKNIVN